MLSLIVIEFSGCRAIDLSSATLIIYSYSVMTITSTVA